MRRKGESQRERLHFTNRIRSIPARRCTTRTRTSQLPARRNRGATDRSSRLASRSGPAGDIPPLVRADESKQGVPSAVQQSTNHLVLFVATAYASRPERKIVSSVMIDRPAAMRRFYAHSLGAVPCAVPVTRIVSVRRSAHEEGRMVCWCPAVRLRRRRAD
jgi:hypothetical protein